VLRFTGNDDPQTQQNNREESERNRVKFLSVLLKHSTCIYMTYEILNVPEDAVQVVIQ
jgi:hypothetical protein